LDTDVDTDTDIDTDTDADGSLTWKKVVDMSVDAVDKRQFTRYSVADNRNPIAMEQTNGIEGLLDVSRGGISVKHNNTIKVGDVLPVHISYGGLDIKADVKVVSASSNRAGAQFVNLDPQTANQILYLNMVLDDVNSLPKK
jgi:hypothetical protein